MKWGLAHLSDATIQRRFLSPKPRFTAGELRYLTEVDGHDHVALVAIDDDGHLVGVGRFVRLEDPAEAEVAVVIADHLQGQGLGTRIGYELVDEAARPWHHALQRHDAGRQPPGPPAHGQADRAVGAATPRDGRGRLGSRLSGAAWP